MPKFWIFGFMVVLLSTGCYEEQEGCLDPMATNYDVSADLSVDCEYPKLSFSVDHRWGEEIYSPDSFYTDAVGDTFQLRFLGLFVRELAVDTGMNWTLLNPVERNWPLINNAMITDTEAIGFIQARNFENSWGELDFIGSFDGLRMQLGLGQLETIDPEVVGASHPLNIRPQMYDTTEEAYYGWVLRYRTDTSSGTPIRQISSAAGQEIEWSQQVSGTFPPAVNSSLIFELNYAELLRDFRVENSNDDNRAAINGRWLEALVLRDS